MIVFLFALYDYFKRKIIKYKYLFNKIICYNKLYIKIKKKNLISILLDA